MTQISNAGTYRGRILEHAVTQSTNGFPQWVPKLIADQMYDEDSKEWVGLSDTPDITAYLVLVDGKDRKTLNCKQVELVTEWNAQNLLELEEMDLTDKPVQFRVKESKFNNNINLQVEWIDEYGAVPGRILKRLDPAAIKAMQGKFGKAFSGSKPATKPVTAPKTLPRVSSTVKKLTTPVRNPSKPTSITIEGKCTLEEAFEYVSDKQLWNEEMDDKKVSDIWIRVVGEIAGDRPDKDLTPEECFTIREKVTKEVFRF